MPSRIVSWLIGPPLRTDASQHESLGVATGIPALGLDALASAAYGPEAALTVLLPLGVAGPALVFPLAVTIVALLIVVQFSYRQTIAAYPSGGGSYVVASRNLGRRAGLLAGAALWVDYLLNAAVAISAGVGALVSAVPALLPHTLLLCLGILLALTAVNLRGVRDSAVVLAVPTYLFVGCLSIVVILALTRWAQAAGHPAPAAPPRALPIATTTASAWLLLRAFANGCTAMTGVEAVSNAVPLFRKPRVARARRTLAMIVAILGFLVVGVGCLSRILHIGATPPGQPGYESVLSQLTRAVVGRGFFYYVTMGAITAVLCLSANTSFAAFPRLCRQLALDGYLPRRFAHLGLRLVYTTGIGLLALLAGVLLVLFGGVTDRLVPLFAVGAFLAFTLSQLGMVVHWHRARGQRFRAQALAVNAAGALATTTTLVIVLVAKLAEGAWLTVVAVGALLLLFDRIHARSRVLEQATKAAEPFDVTDLKPPLVLVPLQRLDRVSRNGLRFALTISDDVTALQVLASDPGDSDLSPTWHTLVEQPCRQADRRPPKLVVLRSSFRRVVDPIVHHVRRMALVHPGRPIVIVVTEVGERRWYRLLLRHYRATALKARLLFEGGPGIVVANTPWYVEDEPGGRAWSGSNSLPSEGSGVPTT
jgi:amino acid transporter